PLYIREKRNHNCERLKAYVAVFICFSAQTIYLELVSDLVDIQAKRQESCPFTNRDRLNAAVCNYLIENKVKGAPPKDCNEYVLFAWYRVTPKLVESVSLLTTQPLAKSKEI
ncbi:hypothetical protein V1477_019436, partial [Vespula maculifrons]